ncbi:MAG: putative hydro-lyase [Rhodanobacter sp.]
MPIDHRHPRDIRADIRAGRITGVTTGLGAGHAQANLVALPNELADDFLLFCRRNPKPCPVIEVTHPGGVEPVASAPGADLRTDIPRYRIYRDGAIAAEVTDATPHWRDDLVAFLLGCSFTFEWALLDAGIPLRHLEQGRNVAMWRTSIDCQPAGIFHGPLAVSMRPIPAPLVGLAVSTSSRFPGSHGAPIHVGDPAVIGITDLARPDWGDAVEFEPGDIPVFWACGVTPQAVALASTPAFLITHSPGHMFLTDIPNSGLAIS